MDYINILFLIGRILYGGFFLMMGLNHLMKLNIMKQYSISKNVPSPGFFVFLTGLLLIIGGGGILLGIYIKLAVVSLVLFLLPVSLKMHNFWAIRDPQQKMMEMINFLKNMAFLGAALMMLLVPQPWPFSF